MRGKVYQGVADSLGAASAEKLQTGIRRQGDTVSFRATFLVVSVGSLTRETSSATSERSIGLLRAQNTPQFGIARFRHAGATRKAFRGGGIFENI